MLFRSERFGLLWGLSSMGGALLAGLLAHPGPRRRAIAPLRISMVSVLLTMVGIFAVCAAPDTASALFWVVPTGLANGAWLVPVQAALQDLVVETERATAVAVFACLSLVIGFLGPWCVGALSDAFVWVAGGRGLALAMAIVALASLVSAAGFHFAHKRLDLTLA